MALDTDLLFRQGGPGLVAYLQYSVLAARPDLLFLYLAHEYAVLPTRAKAEAIYQLFCAPQAPARISAHELLPPRDLRLARALAPPRAPSPPGASEPPLVLSRHLFAPIVARWQESPPSALRDLYDGYDPARTPHQNLPGGRQSAGQRAFVEKLWQPRLRPDLVKAGFWRLSSIG